MNLLITGTIKKDDELFSILEKMGHTITYIEDEREELNIDFSKYEGIICNSLFLYTPIEKFSSLKYIQLTSAGTDRIPIDYIKEHNIKLFNASGVYSIPIAEYVLCEVLNIYKQTNHFNKNQPNKEWVKNRELQELNDKTACIVGCGSIGTECAKRFKVFNTKVIGIDIVDKKDANYDAIYQLDKLDEVIKETNIVVLTLPLTKETFHLFNKERLSLLNKDSILVNVCRGQIVDEKALVEVLPNIKAAILDVFEEEPLNKDNPLWNMNNVVITPHNSYVGESNNQRLNKLVEKNLIKYGK